MNNGKQIFFDFIRLIKEGKDVDIAIEKAGLNNLNLKEIMTEVTVYLDGLEG